MQKTIKITAIIIGLALIGLVGRCFYMVACISCTYPPIKEYKFEGTVEQFGEALHTLSLSDANFTYKISRRDSTQQEDNGDRDMVVNIKHGSDTIRYDLVCDPEDSTAHIKLVAAFKNTTYGGYTGESPKVKLLLGIFESDFLKKLKQTAHVVLTTE
ncbi:hypothetical protein [Mucilaginibacter sp.]|uniref:hypothetical protein n=1 Tax=Mucilaginibacter sp. TaxID=1882438 RepID=UPI0025D25425|nr:hypothetical protein [Mucilaginibacter sp.]